jgi:predicted amidohydrolase/ribosomal protein S18 acetylase RimI-like enzyme
MDFSDYETPIAIRQAVPEDHPAIIELQRLCFPGMKPWTAEQLQRHHEVFPAGQIVVEVDVGIIGSSSSMRIDFDDHPDYHTFDEITGNGMLETHDDDGPDLYGIEVMVHPDRRGMKVGERLYQARGELAEQLNIRRILIAGRMPKFAAFKGTAKEYVRAVRRQELADPILGFQLKQEFRPVRVLEKYLPGDAESEGRALLMEWSNIEYRPPGRRHQKASNPVRICVIQYQLRKVTGWEDFAQQTEYFVDVASNYKSDFAVFPELLTTQLLSCVDEKRPSEAVRSIPKFTDEYIEHFTELAVGYNVNILAGTHIVETEEGHLENVAFLFRRDGTIDRQSKLHVTPNEARWWGIQGGQGLRIIETDVGPIAINICYDVEFPELGRLAADRGARILFVPYCTEDRQGHLRVKYCAQARAVENQMFVVTAGTVGNLPDSANMDIQYAQSGVFTPSDFTFPRDGIAAEATANVETVVVADLDLEMLRRVRKSGSVRPLHDRRRDLYELVDLKANQDNSEN